MKISPGWSKRQLTTARAWYASRVLRTLLLAVAGIIVGTTFSWPSLEKAFKSDDLLQHRKLMRQILRQNPTLSNKLIHPRLESLDKKGHPFALWAQSAIQVSQTQASFDRPQGRVHMEDGTVLSFESSKGTYDQTQNRLKLTEKVHLSTDKGYDLYTEEAWFDLTQSSGHGEAPVTGTGPSGEKIQAQGFRVDDKGDHIHFTGKTSISLPGVS